MKASGVIVEYNPFHNGHKFHIDQTRQISGADVIIAVMSGNFLQRGEPALVSKWTRAEMALRGGADLVFELPFKYATQNADIFACGAMSILAAAGCSHVCFGSESGQIRDFSAALDFLEQHQQVLQASIKENMKDGHSYPKAMALAFESLPHASPMIDLSKPNNILGLQYMAAIRKQGSSIEAFTVPRKGAGYHDENLSSSTIASATSIRKAIFSNKNQTEEVQSYLPPETLRLLNSYKQEFGQFHSWKDYWDLLQYTLLKSSGSSLSFLHGMEEGLENRMMESALHADSFQAFMESAKTKRYTWTRLQRASLYLLLQASKEEMQPAKQGAEYLRLLGMSDTGRAYLRKHKKDFGLPLVSKASADKERLELDIRASRIYALGLSGSARMRLMKKEFSEPPLMISRSSQTD